MTVIGARQRLRDRVLDFFAWTLHRITGSAIETESEQIAELSSRAVFPGDEALLARQGAARDRLPPNSVVRLSPFVAAQRFIEEQPDVPRKPLPLPDDFV